MTCYIEDVLVLVRGTHISPMIRTVHLQKSLNRTANRVHLAGVSRSSCSSQSHSIRPKLLSFMFSSLKLKTLVVSHRDRLVQILNHSLSLSLVGNWDLNCGRDGTGRDDDGESGFVAQALHSDEAVGVPRSVRDRAHRRLFLFDSFSLRRSPPLLLLPRRWPPRLHVSSRPQNPHHLRSPWDAQALLWIILDRRHPPSMCGHLLGSSHLQNPLFESFSLRSLSR